MSNKKIYKVIGIMSGTSMDGLDCSFIETDDANKLGVSPAASYGYDGAFDAPEPPSGGSGNWVSLYFPHPEWGNQWGDNFTQDVVLEDDEFFQSNLTVWPVEVLSNMSGQTSVTFEYIQKEKELANG